MEKTGDLRALDLIEKRCGRVGIVMTTSVNRTDNMQSLAKLTKEAGEAITVISEALIDNRITPEEARCCSKVLLSLIQRCNAMLFKLQEIEK